MRTVKFLIIAVMVLAVASASQAALGVGLGVKAGSLGLGAELSKSLGKKFALRGSFQQLTYSTDGEMTEQEVEYVADLNLSSWSAVADWHPWAGAFYLSGGLVGNGNEIIGTATPMNARQAGSRTYSIAEQGSLAIEVTWPSTAPYIGIGWGNQSTPGGGLFMDIGAMLQGPPKVAMHGTGMIAASSANAPQVEEDVKGATTWIVFSLGFAFGF